MNRPELKALLTELCSATGISGDENKAAETACGLLKKYCPDAHISGGSVIGTFGSRDENAPHVLLDAHIDQVGLIVTSVTEDGFVTVGNVGGLDRRLLPAQHVKIHGTRPIDGIICCMPPHLTDGSEKPLQWEQVHIDTGYPAEELRKMVSPGDSVTFCGVTAQLPGGRFASPALDDRCGMAAILYALELLQDEEIPCKVTVLFSSQEEVGELGAKTACFSIDPDIALAVDVSFSGDGSRCETGVPGDGAMIGFSPSLSREISAALMATALMYDIPYQREVMPGTTGTNADQFSVSREGVKACTVSIPIYYMHTPQEVVDLADVENTGMLLASYLRGCEEC